jgi:hypothetical protein
VNHGPGNLTGDGGHCAGVNVRGSFVVRANVVPSVVSCGFVDELQNGYTKLNIQRRSIKLANLE